MNGTASDYGPGGAGGSVWIDAKSLTGTGSKLYFLYH